MKTDHPKAREPLGPLGLTIVETPVGQLKASPRNPRTHSKRQIRKIADSIQAFGFTVPLMVDEHGNVLAGNGRLAAALQLGRATVPVVRIDHLSETQKRAYVIADNKIATLAGWDRELLAIELGELAIHLPEIGLDLDITGFEIAELDVLTSELDEDRLASKEDEVPAPAAPVSRPGLWHLGPHRLICGSACDRTVVDRLLGGERADMVFTDPPYNVPVNGHVMGRGRVQHREFLMASGEMTSEEFTAFLAQALGHAVAVSREGALHFVCMDWRHLRELTAATGTLYEEQKNLIVWNKTNAGQGSLYRSQHELIALYKVAGGPHTNNVELGRHGRNRSNVWTYPGVNSFRGTGDLAMHPTVKPVALMADAIKDVTKRRAVILDPFSGSGSTLIAAETSGRRGYAIELDPAYVDVAIRRYEAITGKDAILGAGGATFLDLATERAAEQAVGGMQ